MVIMDDTALRVSWVFVVQFLAFVLEKSIRSRVDLMLLDKNVVKNGQLFIDIVLQLWQEDINKGNSYYNMSFGLIVNSQR